MLAGNQINFFWNGGVPPVHWFYRRRQYAADWLEAGAIWVDAIGQQLDPTPTPPLPALSMGEFHAAVDRLTRG